jgi:hypothetical protein
MARDETQTTKGQAMTDLPALREAVAKADHIFTASVRSRVADATKSMNAAYDAYNGLRNKDSAYARELLTLASLHRTVRDVWVAAVVEGKK